MRAGLVLSMGVVVLGPTVALAATAPVLSAHRALVSGFAENSLAGFAAAAADGITDIEGDTYVTKDDVLVVSHDSPLRAPACDGPYLDIPLRELDATQVDEMTCHGEPVARLADVIDVVKPYPSVTLRVEIKNASADTAAQRSSDAVLLARQLATSGMTSRSIVQDFDWATTTRAIRSAFPLQRVSALATSITTAQVGAAQSAGAYDFSYPEALSTGFWNRYLAAKGVRSTVWTLNDPVRARAVRAENIGTIITDEPDTLRAAFAAPDSGCTVTRYSRTTALRSWRTPLAPGARLYLKAPRTGPDGRVAETTLVKIAARTSSGTGSLRVGPQGTPYSTAWEKSLGLTTTTRTAVVETALGDSAALRIRNTSTRGVTVTAAATGGTVYTCP